MRRSRTASVLIGVAVFALGAAPASAHVGDGPPGAEAGAKKKKKKKSEPVVCKAGQIRVSAGKRVSCRRLSAAATQREPRVGALLAVVRRDLRLRTRSGRRIPPIWSVGGGRMKSVRARLVRALPKALALGAGRAARARAASVSGDPAACSDVANLPDQTSSFDGFSVTVGAAGAVTMSVTVAGGYRVEVVIDSRATCSNLDLKACPDPDGTLDGTDSRRSRIGLRVTKDGALVNAFQVSARSTQKLKGKVADDARLDTVTLEDVVRETVRAEVPGGSATFSLSVLRTAELDMRSGATRNARVQAGVGGINAEAVGRTVDEYARSFPDLISEERAAYKRREERWQTPGTCAKLTFDPAAGTRKVRRGEEGNLTAKIEANAGGLAAKARWTQSAQENGTFAPVTSPAASQAITYRVTGEPRKKLRLKIRATSTAGVDEREWAQEIDDPVRYFKVTGLEYTDQLALDGVPAIGTCTPSTSQTNTTTLVPSGAAYDGALASSDASGALSGSIIARGNVLKTAAFSGCKLNDDATAYVSCHLLSGGSYPTAVAIDVAVPASGEPRATLQSVGLVIGDVPPVINPCVVFGTQVDHAQAVTDSPPAETFSSPGPHSLSFDLRADVPTPVGGTLHSAAHYALTIVRVNADGSPYTG